MNGFQKNAPGFCPKPRAVRASHVEARANTKRVSKADLFVNGLRPSVRRSRRDFFRGLQVPCAVAPRHGNKLRALSHVPTTRPLGTSL